MRIRTPTTPIVISKPISNNIFFIKFFNYKSYTSSQIVESLSFSKYVLPSKSSINSANTFL